MPSDATGVPRPGESAARVVLGVAGGIAAYKACEVSRLLTEAGHDVTVVPTPAALRFVGAPTWAALSGHPVHTDPFEAAEQVDHVRLGRTADLVLVAPATADLLARAATGRADDLLTATLLTARCPVVFAPAMHTEMWEHPATRANVAVLRERGAVVLDPAVGRLTGPDSGPGRLPDPAEIVATALVALARGPGRLHRDLAGRAVVVSAGGTREPVDPVRFLGNRSSGRQGIALARAAAVRGAAVTLVAANVELADPAGVRVVRVRTAVELGDAVRAAAAGAAGHPADAVVMAAAVADFRPADPVRTKVKRATDGTAPPLRLVQNPDVLAGLAADRAASTPADCPVLVGFAAETGDGAGSVLDHGRAKLARKGCDLLVVNEVGPALGFGTPDNAAVILGADGRQVAVPRTSKDLLAHAVWDAVVPLLLVGDAHRDSGDTAVTRRDGG